MNLCTSVEYSPKMGEMDGDLLRHVNADREVVGSMWIVPGNECRKKKPKAVKSVLVANSVYEREN